MDRYDTVKIRRIEVSQLGLDFEAGQSVAIRNKTYSKYKVSKLAAERERVGNVTCILDLFSRGKISKTDFYGRIKNEALKWGSTLLTAGKTLLTNGCLSWGRGKCNMLQQVLMASGRRRGRPWRDLPTLL